MRRPFMSFAPAVVVAVTLAVGARPGLAAVAPAMSFEHMARAWMGAVALLAHGEGDEDDDHRHGARSRPEGRHEERGGHHHHEHARDGKARGGQAHNRGERCGCGKEGCERCARDRRHGAAGHSSRARGHGHHGGSGAQVVMARMDEILVRLARIEARLDGRAGGPPAAGMHGPRPGRPEVPEHARRMMEERMRHMREGRPEMPAEAREQMRKRMEEGRERMEQAQETIRRMEQRIGKLEGEIERLKADR